MKILILDFDGVIADSLSLQVKSVNKFSNKFGYQKIISVKIFKAYNMQEIIEKIKMPEKYLITAIQKIREEASKHYDKVLLFKGINEVLVELSKKYKLIILSSNQESTIKTFLEKNNMKNLFSAIYTGEKLFDKHIIIGNIIKDFNVSKKDVIFIGDEQRDIEAGKKSGIKTGGVTWGYNSKERLIKENPDFLFEKAEELLQLVKQEKDENDSE